MLSAALAFATAVVALDTLTAHPMARGNVVGLVEGADEAECQVAVVGGGWAGVYFAYRMVMSEENKCKVSLFEKASRIGGRTYSVDEEGLTVDIGAYRFSPDMHLPGDLIVNHLNLPTECYEPECKPASADFPPPFMFNYTAPLRRIVDPVTRLPAGYVTAINTMVDAIKASGGGVHTNTALADLTLDGATSVLNLTTTTPRPDGTTMSSSSVLRADTLMLNLPRNRLFELPSFTQLVFLGTEMLLKCVRFDRPASMFPNETSIKPTSALGKAYLYYDDAWWHTRINSTEGEYPANAFVPILDSSGIYIGVHWNDGPVECASPTKCRGFLEVYYSVTNETFFSSQNTEGPLGVVKPTTPAGATTLAKVHTALMAVLPRILASASVDAHAHPTQSTIAPPSSMVVGIWNRPNELHPLGEGDTAPTKILYAPDMSGPLHKVCGVDGLVEPVYRAKALKPLISRDANVFLANNDWKAENVYYYYGDWAEESLLMSERALHKLGLAKPDWLNASYYQDKVVDVVAGDDASLELFEAEHERAVREKPTWDRLDGYTFEHYVLDFGKRYDPDELQASKRRFDIALAAIRTHNADDTQSYKQGVNQFTDMAPADVVTFKGQYRSGGPRRNEDMGRALAAGYRGQYPSSLDWRSKGVVTPVKNQGGCGSCWAFSGTEVLESHLAINSGKLVELSEQEYVSCAPNPKDCGGQGGCQGSTQWLLFEYAEKAGITTEASYPYQGITGTCNEANIKPVANISGYVRLPTNDYDALMAAVQLGPVAITLSASWTNYESGVFNDVAGCGFVLDHGVVVVGYGSDPKGGDYWIVRNSWGEGWGEGGYIRLMRDGNMTCGIDTDPSSGTKCKPYPATQKVCGICGMLSDSSYPLNTHLI